MKITLCDIFPMQCVMGNKITGKEYFQLNNNLTNNNLVNNNLTNNNLVNNNLVNNNLTNNNLTNNNLVNNGALTTLYIIILIMVLIGFFITLLALYLAFKCNKTTPLIIIHVLVAFWFPPIYLLYILLVGCNKNYLKKNNL